MRIFTFILLFTALHIVCFAQSTVLTDSVAIRINQIEVLYKSGELEKAQLEVEDLRWFVKRERLFFPAKSIKTVLGVYRSNRDTVSSVKFLDEVRAGIPAIKDVDARAGLAAELLRVYETGGANAKALVMQKQLTADSAILRSAVVQSRFDSLRKHTDSIQVAQQLASGDDHNYYKLEKNRAYSLLGGLALAFFGLLMGQWMQRRKFETDLADKEDEMRHLKGFLNTQPNQEAMFAKPNEYIEAPPVAQQVQATPFINETETLPVRAASHSSIPSLSDGGSAGMYKPKYQALLVQPNRQIALYLKSLIGPEFEVEMASTHSEAIEMAQRHIPDIVLTDTHLGNSGSGFDLSRQLKQDTKTNQTPVVLFSGAKSLEAAEQDRVRADADIVLPRPLLDDDLDAQLSKLFKERKQRHTEFDQVLQLWFTKAKIEPKDPFLKSMLERIERYLSDVAFSPAELSRIMQYEKPVFNRKTIALTGREVPDVIRIMRLEKAKYMLENRVAPPQVVAGLVGFDNPGAFTRAFKEHFGDTTMLLLNA